MRAYFKTASAAKRFMYGCRSVGFNASLEDVYPKGSDEPNGFRVDWWI